jgi:hypothetical protein
VFSSLPAPARRLIVASTVVAGALAVAAVTVLAASATRTEALRVAVFCLLYVVADTGDARASRSSTSIALGSVVLLAALPLLGPWGAVIVATMSLLTVDTATPLPKRLFNTGQIVLSTAGAGAVYSLVAGQWLGAGGATGRATGAADWGSVLAGVAFADLTLCLVNGLLVSWIVSVTERLPVRAVWQGTFARQILPYLGYGLFGALLAILWDDVGLGAMAALLLLLPLFVARWAYAQYVEQQEAYDRTVRALVQAVETKDYYTRGHSERVSRASVMIARTIGMREDRVQSVRYAGILHDIGKLGVPTRLLHKSGALSEAEYAAIKLHPMRGVEMIRDIEFLHEAYAGIMHHHERLDGLGYPMGLRGEDIPEFARVIAVADAFDSMTSTRSYREARSVEEAVEELRRWAGVQFDERLVEAFVVALARDGWSPAAAPADLAGTAPAAGASFDHDDPTLDLRHPGVTEASEGRLS